MRITFVRHGESEANSSGRWQGQGDSPLSELGRAQAESAAARLRRLHFDRVLSSDLSRARDTARALGREPEVDPALREIHVGAWEGLRRDEVLERFPDEIAALIRGEDVRIGGGESWRDATVRAMRALHAQLEATSPGAELAMFSHGGIITSVFLEVMRARSRRPPPIGHMVNTAISAARFDAEGAVVERYNDAAHVPAHAPSKRRLFGDDATVVGWLAVGPDQSEESVMRHRQFLDDVDVVISYDDASDTLADRLAFALDVPRERTPFPHTIDAQHEAFRSKKVLVLANVQVVDAAISDATRPTLPDARFAGVKPGTLSHIARTRSSTLLADYGVELFEP